nr:unnamed protein product [Digitaria exilis]
MVNLHVAVLDAAAGGGRLAVMLPRNPPLSTPVGRRPGEAEATSPPEVTVAQVPVQGAHVQLCRRAASAIGAIKARPSPSKLQPRGAR